MSSVQFIPGDRVWYEMSNGVWWPGRILTDEELEAMEVPRLPGCDLAIFLYSAEKNEGLEVKQVHSASVTLYDFETSSEKAVTANAELRAAIENAKEDETANKLKSAAASSARSMGAAAAMQNSGAGGGRAAKRRREEGSGAGKTAPAHARKTISALRQIAERLQQASDLLTVRRTLSELDNVDVLPHELEETHIGVAVGNLLGNPSMRAVWPLARAIVSFWSRHLPEKTLEVIKTIRMNETTATTTSAMAALVQPGHHHQLMAGGIPPVSAGSPSSPGAAAAEGGFGSYPGSPVSGMPMSPLSQPFASPNANAPSSPQPPRKKTMGFYNYVYAALDNPLDTYRPSPEQLERVARNLSRGITDKDQRTLLLSRLRDPELRDVRENFLSEKWDAAQYLRTPDDVFITEAQRAEQLQRLTDRLNAEEQAKMALMNETSLFTCGNCGKKRCRYYEQQTRGADEPTTKFITCLECNTTWTEE